MLALGLSVPFEAKTEHFIHLSFKSTLQLINVIFSDLQNLYRYFNVTAIVVIYKISFATLPSVVPKNLVLYLKDLKSSVFTISLLKLIVSSFE